MLCRATLAASGVQDQDLVVLTRRPPAAQPSNPAAPSPQQQMEQAILNFPQNTWDALSWEGFLPPLEVPSEQIFHDSAWQEPLHLCTLPVYVRPVNFDDIITTRLCARSENVLLQVIRTGPDGALLDPQAFINFARSNLRVMSDLPAHLVQAVNQGDIDTLQRVFR